MGFQECRVQNWPLFCAKTTYSICFGRCKLSPANTRKFTAYDCICRGSNKTMKPKTMITKMHEENFYHKSDIPVQIKLTAAFESLMKYSS